MFYTESQGPWNGSCSLKHLKPGSFMGHPISFEAYSLVPDFGPRPPEPTSGSRLHIETKRVKQLVPYAVVVHDFNATLLHLFGLDHRQLTVRVKGLDVRLTEQAGEVVERVMG